MLQATRKHFDNADQAIAYAKRNAKQSSLANSRFYVYLDNAGWFVSSRMHNCGSTTLCYGHVENGAFVEAK